jgi:hypothetical protein
MGHVTKNIGGIYDTNYLRHEINLRYSKATQKEAVAAFLRNCSFTPKWLWIKISDILKSALILALKQ